MMVLPVQPISIRIQVPDHHWPDSQCYLLMMEQLELMRMIVSLARMASMTGMTRAMAIQGHFLLR